MKKMMKLLVAVIAICPLIANAEELGYTTTKGCYITEEQYINMKATLTDEEINNYSCDAIDLIKDEENLHVTQKYYKEIAVDTYKNEERILEEISKEEFYSDDDEYGIMPLAEHVTEYKKFTVSATTYSSNGVMVTADLVWRKMPSTRSYDVYALMVNKGGLNISSWQLTQKADYVSTVLQNGIPSGIVLDNNGLGYGASFALSESASSQLSSNLITKGTTYNKPSTITVTYQHAQYDVTYAQSRAYTFSSSGYGSVCNFTTNAGRNSYDTMKGLTLNLSW